MLGVGSLFTVLCVQKTKGKKNYILADKFECQIF